MKELVVVTGHQGYIGSVLVPLLQGAGYLVRGIDAGWYDGCDFGTAPIPAADEELKLDIRDVESNHFDGATAVIHLAALSNDPLGELDAQLTWDINHLGTLRVAEAARAAGAGRFLFSSSCSLYGAASDGETVDELAPSRAVTAYGETKIAAERGLSDLATPTFSPVFLRNATAYGPSPRLRGDLVVNEFAAYAALGQPLEIRSDGSPWRPLVHVADIASAFVAALAAPQEMVHNRAFNVGRSEENFRVREIAASVASQFAGTEVKIMGAGSADSRSYKVNFSRIATDLPKWMPVHGLSSSAGPLGEEYRSLGLSLSDLRERFTRIKTLRGLLEAGVLSESLRGSSAAIVAAG